MTSKQDYGADISQAIILNQPLPVMPKLSIEEGYQLQKTVSKLINSESFPGLKAGLTSKEIQKVVGLDEPLIASIYERGKCESGSTITVTPGHELEFELGVIVDSEGEPCQLVPVVEIVLLDFSKPEDFSLANAIAVNLGADRYLLGAPIPWSESITEVHITATKDGDTIISVKNDYSFGSPKSGVKWMLEEGNKRGVWKCLAGNKALLLLGTCGTSIPAKPGNYEVDFGVLGFVSFYVNP